MNKAEYKAIIIDDEPEAYNYLDNLLHDFEEISVVYKSCDPVNALEPICSLNPDILFLDIQMPEKSGFELLKQVRNRDCNPHVIFVTAFEKFSVEAIKHAAFDYLLKPVDPQELQKSVERFKQDSRKNTFHTNISALLNKLNANKRIKFNTQTGFILVNTSDIIYCEADRNYSFIYTTDNKEVVTCNLGALEKQLASDSIVRISRQYMINLDYLVKIDRKKRICILKSNEKEYSLEIPYAKLRKLDLLIS